MIVTLHPSFLTQLGIARREAARGTAGSQQERGEDLWAVGFASADGVCIAAMLRCCADSAALSAAEGLLPSDVAVLGAVAIAAGPPADADAARAAAVSALELGNPS
eukprot:gene123-4774_t